MSSSNPPYPYYNGITYNPAFFVTTGSGITQSQANALYLQKTTPDTATAVETFSSGILTTSVDVPTSSSNMNIAPGASSGVVNIATAGVRTAIINIANGVSAAAGANLNLNNGTANASTTNIMNGSSTSGACNIMTGTSAGIVNIATGSGSTAVNISNGTTTGAVTIGNLTNAVTISSSSLTLGTPFKTLTVQVPISLNYDPSIISSNTLGYIITGTGSTSSITGGVLTNVRQLTLTFGVWLLTANTLFSTPGTYSLLSISSTSGNYDLNYTFSTVGIAGGVVQVTRIVNTTTSGFGPWYLIGGTNTTSTISNVVYTATRIA